MRCPHCGSRKEKVIESRHNANETIIRRRRECLDCGYRFTSYEKIENRPLMIIKRDGRREPFDPEKMERGIQKSLEKRPVSQDLIQDILHQVEDAAEMKAKSSREVNSRELGDLVLKALYKVDPVAYVRFASVYKMFDNVDEFIEEIGSFKNKKTGGK
jgi:transcriptional repressor NrdR